MNIELYPLLQYTIKEIYICLLFRRANNLLTFLLFFLIDLYYYVCHNRLCEGNDEGLIFIRKVWDCSHVVIGALKEVLVHMTFELSDGI